MFFDDQFMEALSKEGRDPHHEISFNADIVIMGSSDPAGGPSMKERIERDELEKRKVKGEPVEEVLKVPMPSPL